MASRSQRGDLSTVPAFVLQLRRFPLLIDSSSTWSPLSRTAFTTCGGLKGEREKTTMEATIKTEPNHLLRRSVFPCEVKELYSIARAEFSAYTEVGLCF